MKGEALSGVWYVYHNIGVPIVINISNLMFILYALFHVQG